ncbi:hypothetical protein [Modestobacter lacusdianchii]
MTATPVTYGRVVTGVGTGRATAQRLLVIALAASALMLTGAPAAQAHTDRGVAGSNWAGRVLELSSPMPGVDLSVTQFGDSLEILNGSTVTITVYGYSDEEYLRIGPDGVWRNENSPATHLNLRRDGRTALPANAAPDAAPDWRQVSTQPEYSWHDHRTHWMLSAPPPQVAADPESKHTITNWTVPVSYGDTAVAVGGELTWSPPPEPLAWWPLYLLIPIAGLLAGLLPGSARPLTLLLLTAVVSAVWHVAATPQPGLTAADRALATGAAMLPALVAMAVTTVAVRAAWRGKDLLAAMLSAVVGFMLLVQGLPDMDVLWAANVITGGPVWLARATVAFLIFGGVGLMLGAATAVRRFRRREPTAAPVQIEPAAATTL